MRTKEEPAVLSPDAQSVEVSPGGTAIQAGLLEEPRPASTPIPPGVTLETRPLVCSPLAEIDPAWLKEIISKPFEVPAKGKDNGHPGIDLAFYNWRGWPDIDGFPVQSVLDGVTVLVIEERPPFGHAVLIESAPHDLNREMAERLLPHPGRSLYVLYAHLREPPQVALGERVACGQELGRAGSTGFSGAPHLHLEARLGPSRSEFPGMAFYDTRATESEMASYRMWRMSGIFQPIDALTLWLE